MKTDLSQPAGISPVVSLILLKNDLAPSNYHVFGQLKLDENNFKVNVLLTLL